MRIAPVAEVKARFSAYLRQCEDGPIIITRNGRPAALLIAAPDDDELERLILAHTPRFRQLLGEARERVRKNGGINHEEFWDLVEESGTIEDEMAKT